MTHPPTAGSPTAPAKSLPARFLGILFAPRATYASVVAHPRWLGIFLVVWVIMASTATALLSTEIGRNAVLDQQIQRRPMTQQEIDQMERFTPYFRYLAPVFPLVFLTVGCAAVSGVAFAVFNAALGGDASFKEVFAVAMHSAVVLAFLTLFTTPLAYVRESLSSATNLAIFLPFLDETSFLAQLLGSIDLIYIWWLVSLSIGLAVLYRKRTAPIATTLLGVYVTIGLIVATVKTISTGV
jgi:hypothetical protein